MHRAHLVRHTQAGQHAQEFAIALHGGPRRERDEGGREIEARLAEDVNHFQKIGAGVSLVEPLQHGVIHRFDG